jgi:hypothetical protein
VGSIKKVCYGGDLMGFVAFFHDRIYLVEEFVQIVRLQR